MEKRKVIAVVGPTASGKSDFAVELALKLSGEIVSVDSRQMYKGLDIGAGKITKEEMKGVRHHMLSVYDLSDDVSITKFTEDALKAVENIFSRGKVPILCGGSGQYMNALLYKREFPNVPPNNELRTTLTHLTVSKLQTMVHESTFENLHESDKKNRVRLMRLIELQEAGVDRKPLHKEERFESEVYVVERSLTELRNRIKKRLIGRLNAGMVEEVRGLLSQGVSKEKLLSLGLEYTYITKFLFGEIDGETLEKELEIQIWRYAKRQMTWNKKYITNAKMIPLA